MSVPIRASLAITVLHNHTDIDIVNLWPAMDNGPNSEMTMSTKTTTANLPAKLGSNLAERRTECLASGGRQLWQVLWLEKLTSTAKFRAEYFAGDYRVTRIGKEWRMQMQLGKTWVTQSQGDASRIYDVARRSRLGYICRHADTVWTL